jgi:hypothetical protein
MKIITETIERFKGATMLAATYSLSTFLHKPRPTGRVKVCFDDFDFELHLLEPNGSERLYRALQRDLRRERIESTGGSPWRWRLTLERVDQ